MSPRSFYKLLFLSLVSMAAAVGVWILTPDHSVKTFFGERLLPGLMEKINTVEVVSVEHGGKTLTFLHNADGEWTLMEENGYPADKDRIRNVLLGLAHLEKIEPKTALPEFYTDLQVEDNTAEASKSYLVTLLNTEGEQVTSLLVGKRISGISWDGQGYFVRFPNDAQSWLVRGNLDVTGDEFAWLNARILPLVTGRTATVTLVDGTKTRKIVYQREFPDLPLQVAFMSDPHFLISRDYIENMEKTLTSFDFVNAVKRPADLEKEPPFASAVIDTVDGLTVYLFLYLIDSKPYAAAFFDFSETAQEPVQKEARDLNETHGRWLYEMSSETVSGILPFLSVPEEEKTENAPTEKKNRPAKKTVRTKKSGKKAK